MNGPKVARDVGKYGVIQESPQAAKISIPVAEHVFPTLPSQASELPPVSGTLAAPVQAPSAGETLIEDALPGAFGAGAGGLAAYGGVIGAMAEVPILGPVLAVGALGVATGLGFAIAGETVHDAYTQVKSWFNPQENEHRAVNHITRQIQQLDKPVTTLAKRKYIKKIVDPKTGGFELVPEDDS